MTSALCIALAAALGASLVLYRRVGLQQRALEHVLRSLRHQEHVASILGIEVLKLHAECKRLEAESKGHRNGHTTLPAVLP